MRCLVELLRADALGASLAQVDPKKHSVDLVDVNSVFAFHLYSQVRTWREIRPKKRPDMNSFL